MGWNYRIIRHKASGEPDYLQIHEVFYDEVGRPDAVTEDGAKVGGDTVEELAAVLSRMQEALLKPAIDADAFIS